MSAKGDDTRERILTHAITQASTRGLGALTIGELAKDLELSKSGLFAHFQSKERLQIAVLEAAAERFAQTVVSPALSAPRGVQRLQAMVEGWLLWDSSQLPGGCVFIAAGAEFDDQPGAVRDAVQAIQLRWFEFLAKAARLAVEVGDFRSDLDPEDFAFELQSILMGFHHHHRLLRSTEAERRARRSWQRLLARSA
jgi:AcrR family transcriptional regulator